MATTKLGNTKSASRAINYAEKRAIEKSGHNLDIDYAKSHMKMTRSMFGKEDGVQAHTVIQSFKPNEISSEKANEIGLELAKEIAPEHQVAVYTHDDTDHIHNHIIINSVNLEDGKKYQSNAQQREFVKDKNDEICRERGLSVVTEKNASLRYTLAEQHLLEKGQTSWKAELREAINYVKSETNSFEKFKNQLEADFDIEVKLRGKTLSFKHPDRNKFVRGKKLGADYEMEGINRELGREARTQEAGTSFDWNEFERSNQLQSENVRNRTSERADSAENRPISRKYREQQQANEREHQSNDRSNERKQRSVKQQDQELER